MLRYADHAPLGSLGETETAGKGRVKARVSNVLATVLLLGGLAGCGLISEGGLMDGDFWQSSPLFIDNDEAELGLAEMAKGNYLPAEIHFKTALRRDSKDVQALLGLGVLYQHTGQTTKAREMYEAILAIRPDRSVQVAVWNDLSPKPVADIASVNLALLESGGVLGSMEEAAPAGRSQFALAPSSADQALAAPPAMSDMPSGTAMAGRVAPTRAAAAMPNAGTVPMLAGGDANVVSRFGILTALRDQGLITPDEFKTRRQANIGSLLPLTSPPPAAGLDRPVPSAEQVSGRLRAIGRALEMRAITIGQHSSERTMILDALLPAAPVVVANPGAPPQGLLAAADAVRRLEQLKAGGFINSDENAKERTAIERAMQPAPIVAPKARATADTSAEKEPDAKMTGPQPGVHLASYRSQRAADRGWAQLRRAHRSLLGNLQSEVSKVNLGPKGTWYRLKAGPVESTAGATELCRKLKRRRQKFCEPSFIGAG